MSEGVMRNSCSKGSPGVVEKQRKRLNQRQKARILLVFSVAFLAVIAILGVVLHDAAMVTDFSRKNIAPCLKYLLVRTGWAEICFTVLLPVYP